jgi:hypothetical protein
MTITSTVRLRRPEHEHENYTISFIRSCDMTHGNTPLPPINKGNL